MSLKSNEQMYADLEIAQRRESESRWGEASRVYLSALIDYPEVSQAAIKGLERCAQRAEMSVTRTYTSPDVRPEGETEVDPTRSPSLLSKRFLTLGYLCDQQWGLALRTVGAPPQQVTSLSPNIALRWPTMIARLSPGHAELHTSSAEGWSAVAWIVILVIVDHIASRGHTDELSVISRHVLHSIKEPIYRALVYYELGRAQAQSGHYQQGALDLERALELTQELKAEVIEVLERSLEVELSRHGALTPLIDHVIELRCELLAPELLDPWVQQTLAKDITPTPKLALELGRCLERLTQARFVTEAQRAAHREVTSGGASRRESALWGSPMRDATFICYAMGLNAVYESAYESVYESASESEASSLDGSPKAQRERESLHAILKPDDRAIRDELFDQLTRIALGRVGDRRGELEEDEPTIDSDESTADLHQDVELVEEGESRLLLQLRELGQFELIERFFQHKTLALHLTATERARAFNSLAQIAFSARNNLEEAVEYVWRGAQLNPAELKVANLIREAQRLDDWRALERLLLIQLKLTQSSDGRETVRRALAQGYRRAQAWFKSYEMLIELGAEAGPSVGPESVDAISASSTLSVYERSFDTSTERLISSLLRVKGAALAIGDELIIGHHWGGLLRLAERLQWRGEVVVRLLTRGVNQPEQSSRFAKPLAALYAREDRWSEWVGLIIDAPRSSWEISEWGPLIDDALSRSADWAPELKTRLLKARAEWVGEDGGSLEAQLDAWRVYLDDHPADLNALEKLYELAVSLDAWSELGEEVAAAYERAFSLRKVGKQKVLEVLADLYGERLDRPDDAARVWRIILELSPTRDDAGEWLTLYHAQRRDWYQLLLTCALWDPRDQTSRWIESKVRAHLGLGDLSEAHFWWSQLDEAQAQAQFTRPLFDLACDQRSGEVTLKLLKRMSGAAEQMSAASPRGDDRTRADDVRADELSFERSGDSTISERDDTQAQDRSAPLSQLDLTRIKARALEWLTPPDTIGALHAWESADRQAPLDPEATYALARLYTETHQRRELLKLAARIDREAELVLAHRSTLIRVALSLESRFAQYTEAFKCWLAIYEHSPRDHRLCLYAFHRLTARDLALRSLTSELYKLRINHAVSAVEKRTLLAELSALLYQDKRWDLACETLERELAFEVVDERDVLKRIEEYATPLGMWEWAAQMSSSLSSWYAARFTAEVIETRLGDHAQAEVYYQEAITRLNGQLARVAPKSARHSALIRERDGLLALLKRDRYASDDPPERITHERLAPSPSELSPSEPSSERLGEPHESLSDA